MTQGMQPLKSEMRDGSRKKKKQANVVNKLDNLYRFIRRLGLHYKISENFGSTTITIGSVARMCTLMSPSFTFVS